MAIIGIIHPLLVQSEKPSLAVAHRICQGKGQGQTGHHPGMAIRFLTPLTPKNNYQAYLATCHLSQVGATPQQQPLERGLRGCCAQSTHTSDARWMVKTGEAWSLCICLLCYLNL